MSLQTPTEFYPDNGQVITNCRNTFPFVTQRKDPATGEMIDVPADDLANIINQPVWKFKFNCSGGNAACRWVNIEYKNLKTGKVKNTKVPRYGKRENLYYNGDIYPCYMSEMCGVKYSDGSYIAYAGEDWQITLTLFQTDATSVTDDDEIGRGLYDIYFGRTKVMEYSDDSNLMFKIDKNIPNLETCYVGIAGDNGIYRGDTFDFTTSDYYIIGGTYLEIAHEGMVERKLVKSYDRKTGTVTLMDAFSFTLTKGMTVKMFCNYLKDRPHYYKIRSIPNFYLSDSFLYKNYSMYRLVTLTSIYKQFESVGIRNYRYSVYKTNPEKRKIICDNLVKTDYYEASDKTYEYSYIAFEAPSNYSDIKVGDLLVIGNSSNGYQSIAPIRYVRTTDSKDKTLVVLDHSDMSYFNFLPTGASYKIIREYPTEIYRSDKIYSSDLIHGINVKEVFDNTPLKFKLEVTTMDNITYDKNIWCERGVSPYCMVNFKNDIKNEEETFMNNLCDISITRDNNIEFKLNFNSEAQTYLLNSLDFSRTWGATSEFNMIYLFRTDLTGSQLVDYVEINSDTHIYTMRDCSQRLNQDCTYSLAFRTHYSNSNGNPYGLCYYYEFKDSVKANSFNWNIYGLRHIDDKLSTNETKFNKKHFQITQSFEFISEIEGGDITSHLGFHVHNGGEKPCTTRCEEHYESGSFSADLLTVACTTENGTENQFDNSFTRQNQWLEFIKNNDLFMLKSPKGDVWVVSLTENGANRSYDTAGNEIFTQISYDWVEVYNINDCIIHSGED